MPDSQVAALQTRFSQLRETIAAGDLSDVGDAIHAEILSACGNRRLQRMIAVHGDQVAWIQSSCYRVGGDLRQSFQTILPPLLGSRGQAAVQRSLQRAFREHEAILLALAARDAAWAEMAMRAHIRATLDDVLEALASARAATLDSGSGGETDVDERIPAARD
jgi:DNA-binding GntR family transcriptional regulator